MNETNWGSRKLLVTGASLIILAGLPVVYKSIGISDQITMIVLGAISAAASSYNAFNTLSKKYEASDDNKPSV
jgi:hypothetical protein